MNRLIRAAQQVQECLDLAHVRFCFIGGFAAQRHAEPRLTRDVDVSVLTGIGNEARIIDLLTARFATRRPDAREFALRARVLLLKTDDEIGIDATLTALAFEAEIIDRSSLFEFAAGVFLRTASAEDLLIMKVFAGRPIDWRDVEMILRRYRASGLDLAYVRSRLPPLLAAKDELDSMNELERMLLRFC